MKDVERKFLELVEAFMARWNYSPTEFGRASVGDPNFVQRLRRGTRSPMIKTLDRVLNWMERRGRAHEKGIGLRTLGNGLATRRVVPKPRIPRTPEFEAKIATLLKQGESWAAIGRASGISARTVKRIATQKGWPHPGVHKGGRPPLRGPHA